MKKFKKISYIFLIVVIIILGFVIYSISASDNNNDIREKAKTEIFYFENKLVYMFNSLNNIEFENYKLSVEDISKESKRSTENSSSAGNGDDSSGGSSGENSSSGGSSGENSSSGGSSGQGSSGEGGKGSSSGGDSSTQNTKKYSLNNKGILNEEKEINWSYLKNEAEMLQGSISTMTLDLYSISLNNTDILNFSKEFDNLLIALKEENKENSLKELTLLYSYMPKFIKNCNTELQTEIIISTKYSVFKAYSILDGDKWDEMAGYIQEANDKFGKMLTNVNIENKNQYMVNKCYILLNELQNSVNLKDKEIFLIKYRNLLEDLNNL